MAAEHRKSTRRAVSQGARIALVDGSILGTCQVCDVSVTGARLELKPSMFQVPDHFLLLLSYDGRLRRQCAVVWRTRDSIGVEFIAHGTSSRTNVTTHASPSSGLG
jgi:PilZ domain